MYKRTIFFTVLISWLFSDPLMSQIAQDPVVFDKITRSDVSIEVPFTLDRATIEFISNISTSEGIENYISQSIRDNEGLSFSNNLSEPDQVTIRSSSIQINNYDRKYGFLTANDENLNVDFDGTIKTYSRWFKDDLSWSGPPLPQLENGLFFNYPKDYDLGLSITKDESQSSGDFGSSEVSLNLFNRTGGLVAFDLEGNFIRGVRGDINIETSGGDINLNPGGGADGVINLNGRANASFLFASTATLTDVNVGNNI